MALCEGSLWAQAFPMFNGSSNTCSGAFLDSGGEGATGYGNNENITYTICPDSPNDAISLNFITFNLSTAGAAPLDQMTIHDGNSTAATSLGTYTGTTLQNITVQASPLNSSGLPSTRKHMDPGVCPGVWIVRRRRRPTSITVSCSITSS